MRRLALSLRNTFLPDEAFVQTALLAEPAQAARVVNHNLRYLLWPHQFYALPEDYWYAATIPEYHRGGPMVLNASTVGSALVSSALVARKFDATWQEVARSTNGSRARRLQSRMPVSLRLWRAVVSRPPVAATREGACFPTQV